LPRIAAVTGGWHRVGARSYGATIYRVGSRYVKLAPRSWGPHDLRLHPAGEAERLQWLGSHGFPVPDVVDVGADDDWAWLVTAARPGVPITRAGEVTAAAVDAFADLTRELHRVPPGGCPYHLGVTQLLDWARRATRAGWVDTADLDPGNAGRTSEELLATLEAAVPPAEVVVVAHGDLTPDNILVDPRTAEVTAVLDAGRLGLSDAWRDLAVARRTLAELGPGPPDRFLARCGAPPDPARETYYRLVDEFL
jgi:aminoglycoside phosphotransferase